MKPDDPDIPESVLDAWKQALGRMPAKALQALAAAVPALNAGFRPGRIDPKIALARAVQLLGRRSDWPDAFTDALRAQTLQPTLLALLSEEAIGQAVDATTDPGSRGELLAAMLLDPREPVRQRAFERLERFEPAAEGAGPQATRRGAAGSTRPPHDGGDGPAGGASGPNVRNGANGANGEDADGATPPPSGTDTARDTAQDTGQGAATALRQALAPLLAPLATWVGAPGDEGCVGDDRTQASPTASAPPAPAARAPRTAGERQLVQQARSARLEAARLRRSVGALESGLATEQARLARLQSEHAQTQAELAAARRELQSLQRQFDERVRQLVQARVSDDLVPWLAPARQLADFAQAPADEPLQAARRVLDEQRQLDRRHGLRSALRDEHEACAVALRQLQDAQRDAMVPHPGLPGAIERLRERMRRIDRQLERSAPVPAVGTTLQRLSARLAEATTLEQVSRLRRTLLHCEALDLFDDAELDAAYRLIDEATSRAYARAEADPATRRLAENLAGVPLHALRRALAGRRACELVIDGHNVLHKLHRQLGERARASGPGSAEARTALIESVCSLGARHPGLHLHLWFDSSMPEDLTLRGNVGVHYSGGQGQDRADRQIVAHLEFLARERPGTLAAVVSADGEIVAAAEQAGALVLAPHEFGGWLAPGS